MRKAWLEVAQLSYIIQRKAEVSLVLLWFPSQGVKPTLRKEEGEKWLLNVDFWATAQGGCSLVVPGLKRLPEEQAWERPRSCRSALSSPLTHFPMPASCTLHWDLTPKQLHLSSVVSRSRLPVVTDHHYSHCNPSFRVAITVQLWTQTFAVYWVCTCEFDVHWH